MSTIGWRVHGDGRRILPGAVVNPDERLSWPRTVGIGMQHVVAMFGATILVPAITGFPASTTLFFSAVGTVLFLVITGNRLPSYLGSSFAFIAPVMAAMASGGISAATGGILLVVVVLAIVGVIVHLWGATWIDIVMPPIVTGTIVALIGINLAPAAWGGVEGAPLTAVITIAAIAFTTVFFRGMLGRLAILVGAVVGYLAAWLQGAWIKVAPGILLLPLVAAVRRPGRDVVVPALVVCGVVVGAVAAGGGIGNIASFLTDQSTRGLQVESVTATPWVVASLWRDDVAIRLNDALVTWEIVGPGTTISQVM